MDLTTSAEGPANAPGLSVSEHKRAARLTTEAAAGRVDVAIYLRSPWINQSRTSATIR
jgi:hypothetical protein